eukprot:scaffold7006_cov108-Isochrysis_galbana.AAC.1
MSVGVQQNVLRLQVAVDDAERVQVPHGQQDLARVEAGLRSRKGGGVEGDGSLQDAERRERRSSSAEGPRVRDVVRAVRGGSTGSAWTRKAELTSHPDLRRVGREKVVQISAIAEVHDVVELGLGVEGVLETQDEGMRLGVEQRQHVALGNRVLQVLRVPARKHSLLLQHFHREDLLCLPAAHLHHFAVGTPADDLEQLEVAQRHTRLLRVVRHIAHFVRRWIHRSLLLRRGCRMLGVEPGGGAEPDGLNPRVAARSVARADQEHLARGGRQLEGVRPAADFGRHVAAGQRDAALELDQSGRLAPAGACLLRRLVVLQQRSVEHEPAVLPRPKDVACADRWHGSTCRQCRHSPGSRVAPAARQGPAWVVFAARLAW